MNFEKYVNSKMYNFFEIFFKLVYLNVMWLVFGSIGFFVLTIIPATITIYIMVNTILYQQDMTIFKNFFRIFKKEYIPSQKLFLVLLLLGSIAYLDISFFYDRVLEGNNTMNIILLWISLFFGFLYILILIHIGPVYIYFPKLSTIAKVKFALIMGFKTIGRSLVIMLSIILAFLYINYFPFTGTLLLSVLFTLYVYLSLKFLKPIYKGLIDGGEPLLVKDYLK